MAFIRQRLKELEAEIIFMVSARRSASAEEMAVLNQCLTLAYEEKYNLLLRIS